MKCVTFLSMLNVDLDLSNADIRVGSAVYDVKRVVPEGLEPRGKHDHRLLALVALVRTLFPRQRRCEQWRVGTSNNLRGVVLVENGPPDCTSPQGIPAVP